MTTINVLSDDSLQAVKRDHERLRYELRELRVMLRALQSQQQDDGRKIFCRFTLNAALATSDASKAATITNQYGYGINHASTSITVQNFLTATAGVYEYHGASGAAGKAFYDPVTKTWHIFDLQCP